MRGCLLLFIGIIIGAGLMLLARPRQPGGSVIPQSGDVRLTVSDAYLSRRIEQAVSPYGGLQVKVTSLSPSTLILDMDLSAGPLSVPGEIRVEPTASNGAISVHVLSIQIAGIPVPGPLADAAAGAINSSISTLLGSRLLVTGVAVVPQGLSIVGNAPS